MAPQTNIPLAANILGTIGTILWCVQLVPQIWHNWKHKTTEGLPALMMLLWAIAAVLFGTYAVIQNFNIPIQIQPQAWGTLSLVTWAQILVYTHKYPPRKATAIASALFVVFGAVEALLILTLRKPYTHGIEWPILLVGALAALFLAAGILPPYPELWKRGGRVVGINFVFLGMDLLGAIFSLLALVAQQTFDILGGVLYIVMIILELGIFISHFIWLYRTRALRQQAKRAGVNFDDLRGPAGRVEEEMGEGEGEVQEGEGEGRREGGRGKKEGEGEAQGQCDGRTEGVEMVKVGAETEERRDPV